jgi:hypothetical protein
MSEIKSPFFDCYIGVDYSGAETPSSSLKGLRAYMADRAGSPLEVHPPPSPRKYFTRRGIAEWLVERLSEDRPMMVGIDHGFSFPLRYFETHRLPPDWPAFLDDFQHHGENVRKRHSQSGNAILHLAGLNGIVSA